MNWQQSKTVILDISNHLSMMLVTCIKIVCRITKHLRVRSLKCLGNMYRKIILNRLMGLINRNSSSRKEHICSLLLRDWRRSLRSLLIYIRLTTSASCLRTRSWSARSTIWSGRRRTWRTITSRRSYRSKCQPSCSKSGKTLYSSTRNWSKNATTCWRTIIRRKREISR